jgi:hypothetical protein
MPAIEPADAAVIKAKKMLKTLTLLLIFSLSCIEIPAPGAARRGYRPPVWYPYVANLLLGALRRADPHLFEPLRSAG